MNFKYLAIGLLAIVLIVATGFAKEMDMDGMPSQEEMMARWQKVATPGENHKPLDFFTSDWDYTSRMWMAGPENPPMESKGTASAKWIMDGRWVEMTSSGQMMGMDFNGRMLFGYDNYRMHYVSTWIDNFSTTIGMFTGVYDKDANVYTFFGEMDEPMTGEVAKPIWAKFRILSDDSYVFESHDSIYGEGETKVFEITYKRKK